MIRRLALSAALLACSVLPAASDAVKIDIDARVGKHPISPLIYGVNFGTRVGLGQLNAPFNRSGGNTMSTYNWQQNAANHAADWYFESLAEAGAKPGAMVDGFVRDSRAAGAKPMVTVPMLGWVARLGADRALLPSFSVAKYGAQQAVDPYYADAGNGVRPDGSKITGNDPHDAYVASSPATQKAWVRHLVETFGKASGGGVRFYATDNEASLAFETHRDIRPVGIRAAEFRDMVVAYSAMVKSVDPDAQIVGPEEWGYLGYLYSGYDQQQGGAADHDAVQGGRDYIPWLLREWKKAGRPVDVLSIHYYPQSGEFSDDVSTEMQLLRNRSTRELWDPNYVSESWLADVSGPIQLIPRLKRVVRDHYYADTPIALTEYNWGAENHINGATAQADILGILGREGADIATRWEMPAAGSPVFKAMQMYRNYDGRKSTFGDTSIFARVPNPDELSAFAALRAKDGKLTVMLVNKRLDGAADVRLRLFGVAAQGRAQVFQLNAENQIRKLDTRAYARARLRVTVPAQSITLLVMPGG